MAQRHMDRLTSFDASFLANEKGNAHMAIGAVLTCEGPAPGLDEFAAHIRGRLHLLPRMRQRLARPPLQLGRPLWVDHPQFDLRQHVRGATLPAPGTEEQLRALAAEVFSPALDRARPLWQLWLVDGLEDGRFAVLYKTHHALADGIAAVDIGTLLFDPDRDGRPAPAPAGPRWRPQPPPTRVALGGHAARGLARAALRGVAWIAGAIRRPRRTARRAADGFAGLWEVAWALTRPAPKVPLNAPIGPRRSVGWVVFDLARFKRVKDAVGGTVNDVALAVTAAALRRWLDDRGVETDELELKALVPVSIRAEDEHGVLGNKLTAMRGPLPVGVVDPVEQLHAVSAAMDSLKTSKQPLGAEAIWGLNDWFREFVPPLLFAPTAALNFSTRLFNLLVTNFPGPQTPFYVLGRRLDGVLPIGFLAERHTLAIAIFSYDGRIGFGLLADGDAVEVEPLAAFLDDAFEELAGAARIASRRNGDELE
jgi:WS/DGAT/MGAT family acyltransferase